MQKNIKQKSNEIFQLYFFNKKNFQKFSEMPRIKLFSTLKNALAYAKKIMDEHNSEMEEENRPNDILIHCTNDVLQYIHQGLPSSWLNFIAISKNNQAGIWLNIGKIDEPEESSSSSDDDSDSTTDSSNDKSSSGDDVLVLDPKKSKPIDAKKSIETKRITDSSKSSSDSDSGSDDESSSSDDK